MNLLKSKRNIYFIKRILQLQMLIKCTTITRIIPSFQLYNGGMDDKEIEACRISKNEWRCPAEGCNQILTRKQTLKSHLAAIHEVAGKQIMRV